MFKKQQKWIALLLTLAFAWLLQVSRLPLAADTTEQASSASVERETGFIEQTGTDWGRVRPKTSPLLLFAAVVVLAFLYLLIHGIDIDATPRDGLSTSKAGASPGSGFNALPMPVCNMGHCDSYILMPAK